MTDSIVVLDELLNEVVSHCLEEYRASPTLDALAKVLAPHFSVFLGRAQLEALLAEMVALHPG